MMQIEDIKEIYGSLQTIYSAMHTQMQRNMDVYHLKLNAAAPQDFPSIIPATAKRIIRQGVNQLITDTPVVVVECGETKAEQEMSGTLTEVCHVLLQQWDEQNGIPPAQEIAFNLCLHGMAAKNNIFNPACEGLEALQISVPSPINYYPDPAGKFDLIVYQLYVGEIKEMVERWKKEHPKGGWNDLPFTRKDTDTATWVEFVSAKQKGWYVLEGQEGYPVSQLKENPMGIKPTYSRYSGWGITSPDGKPEEKAIGLYDGIVSSLEAQARGLTAVDNHLRLNVYGRYFGKKGMLTKETIGVTPGSITLVDDPKTALEPFPETRVNPDLWNYLPLLEDDIEAMTYNRAVMGGGAVQESGLKSMTRIRQASLNFRPVRRSLELIMGESLKTAISLMKNEILMGKTLKYSGKKSLDPTKVPDKISIKVKYEAVDPEEDTERIEIGRNLLNTKAISLRTFLKDFMRVDNPDEEISQMLAEAVVFQEPNTRMALGAEALKDMGWLDALNAMQQASVKTRPEARNKQIVGSEQRLNESNQNSPVSTHVGTNNV